MLHNSVVRRLFVLSPPSFYSNLFSRNFCVYILIFIWEVCEYSMRREVQRKSIQKTVCHSSCQHQYLMLILILEFLDLSFKAPSSVKADLSHVWGIKRYERSPERNIMEKNVSNKTIVNEDLKIIMQWRQYKITEWLLGANASVFQHSHKV